jgi:hypothetical protein
VNGAGERPFGDRDHRPLADHQDELIDERPRDGRTSATQDAGEGRPRHPHPFGRSLLVQALEVGQPQGFELVETKRLDLKLADRAADRFETAAPRHAPDHPRYFRSSHSSSWFRAYVHYDRMSRIRKAGIRVSRR